MNLRFLQCGQRYAELIWNPGSDNNSPITEYIPYYRTSFDEDGVYTEWSTVPYDKPSGDDLPQSTVLIRITPWGNYTFQVRARNEIGDSDPSPDTIACETDEDVPYKNPHGLCTDLEDPGKLIVTWQVST